MGLLPFTKAAGMGTRTRLSGPITWRSRLNSAGLHEKEMTAALYQRGDYAEHQPQPRTAARVSEAAIVLPVDC